MRAGGLVDAFVDRAPHVFEEPAEDETILEGRVVSVGSNRLEPLGGIPEDQDDDATRFAATATVPKKITKRTSTKEFIDKQTTSAIDESVTAAAARPSRLCGFFCSLFRNAGLSRKKNFSSSCPSWLISFLGYFPLSIHLLKV